MSNIEEILFESFNLGIQEKVFKEVEELSKQKKYYDLKLVYEEAFNNVIKSSEIENFII